MAPSHPLRPAVLDQHGRLPAGGIMQPEHQKTHVQGHILRGPADHDPRDPLVAFVLLHIQEPMVVFGQRSQRGPGYRMRGVKYQCIAFSNG